MSFIDSLCPNLAGYAENPAQVAAMLTKAKLEQD